jgi:hypothetical protein
MIPESLTFPALYQAARTAIYTLAALVMAAVVWGIT